MPADYYAKGKYVGEVARRYDAMREAAGERFEAEDELIGGYISGLPEKSVVLDAPVGTGRFIPFFAARDCVIHGVDISQDMLDIAAKRAGVSAAEVHLQVGDITALDLADNQADYFVSNKFIKWLPDVTHVSRALAELRRVSGKGGLVEIRCVDSPLLELFGTRAGRLYDSVRTLTGKKNRNTRIYAKRHARELLRAAGFKIVAEKVLSSERPKSVYFFVE
jgi:ubiquinone/menaquinone biosynthesis C-methylase UbiE